MGVQSDISEEQDMVTIIVCLSLACFFAALRIGARWYKLQAAPLELEDLLLYFALAGFIVNSALCLDAVPLMFKVLAIGAGTLQPWATFGPDMDKLLREFFCITIFFWTTLWFVKWSLLCTFRKLTTSLPGYTKIWWGIVIFTAALFIASVITNFTTCHSMHAWFTLGACTTDRDARAKTISLWFSLGSDIATDLLIMAVPLRLVWNLDITAAERISVSLIFAVGVITMITGIIRTVSLRASEGGNGTPREVSSQWLIMWASIEGVIAILVGCLPSMAVFVRGRRALSNAQRAIGEEEEDAYGKGSKFGSNYGSKPRPKPKGHVDDILDEDAQHIWEPTDGASDKSTGPTHDSDIVVTQSWRQEVHLQQQRSAGLSGLPESDVEYELDIVGGQPRR